LPWSEAQQAAQAAAAERSRVEQRAIEAADVLDFETWRLAYLDPARLRA
jgi:hypothetical protein